MKTNQTTRWTAGAMTALIAALTVTTALPTTALAQNRNDRSWHHDNRNHDKNGNHGKHKGWSHNDRNRDDDRDDDDRNDNRPWQRDSYQPGNADRWRDQNRWQSQNRSQDQNDHRQTTKNNWRNIAIGAGGVAVLGAITHNKTITFAGAAGALYALDRYEKDRKSQSAESRAQAAFFSRPYFERDGQRFERREVVRNGQRYYQFVRR